MNINAVSLLSHKEIEEAVSDLEDSIMEQLDQMPAAVGLRVLANLQACEILMRTVMVDDEWIIRNRVNR